MVWQTSASELQGAYLPSLKKFNIDMSDLVDRVVSPYTGTNTYSSWLSSRTLYILVQPYYPTDCTPTPCARPPARLYTAPARASHRNRRTVTRAGATARRRLEPQSALTGPDDEAFRWRVSKALELGYRLHGSPEVTFDG